jgi:hypothetical protein
LECASIKGKVTEREITEVHNKRVTRLESTGNNGGDSNNSEEIEAVTFI